mgnify:CR=1 FL=1
MKWVAAIAAFVVLSFLGCPASPVTAEEAVSETIQDVAEAARRARPKDFMQSFSEAFEGPGMSRQKLKAFITRRFLSRGGVAVHLGEISVEVAADQKTATASFVATFPGSTDRLLGKADQYSFLLTFSLENGVWKITSQQNSPISG